MTMAKGTITNGQSWSYKGELILACNCDWGCPCNFTRRPTLGYCQGGYALHVTSGSYGTIKLDGLKFAWFAKWPGQIHEGGGLAGIYIDERANSEQREGLVKILTGKVPGLPWSILAHTIEEWVEPKFVAFEWEFDGVNSRFKAGPYVHTVVEPMRNPITGDEGAGKILLPKGFVWKEGEQASSRSFSVLDKNLRYAYQGKNVVLATVSHSSS